MIPGTAIMCFYYCVILFFKLEFNEFLREPILLGGWTVCMVIPFFKGRQLLDSIGLGVELGIKNRLGLRTRY